MHIDNKSREARDCIVFHTSSTLCNICLFDLLHVFWTFVDLGKGYLIVRNNGQLRKKFSELNGSYYASFDTI